MTEKANTVKTIARVYINAGVSAMAGEIAAKIFVWIPMMSRRKFETLPGPSNKVKGLSVGFKMLTASDHL